MTSGENGPWFAHREHQFRSRATCEAETPVLEWNDFLQALLLLFLAGRHRYSMSLSSAGAGLLRPRCHSLRRTGPFVPGSISLTCVGGRRSLGTGIDFGLSSLGSAATFGFSSLGSAAGAGLSAWGTPQSPVSGVSERGAGWSGAKAALAHGFDRTPSSCLPPPRQPMMARVASCTERWR